MPLIDLKTNLKDLKFGHDRLNGGSSKQPYIETPITTDLEGNNPWNKDFILRGGIDTVENSIVDVKRLGKFFLDLDSPSGLLFVLKQNLLSRVAARPQSKYNRILNEGIYTPISTLAQAAGSAFGLHVNKQGLNPFQGIGQAYTPDRYMEALYDEIQLASSTDGVPTRNRLYGLYNFKIENLKSPLVTENLKYTNVSENPNVILTYPGGPESVLGIGKTNIKFADQRTGENNPNLKNSGFFTKNNDTKSYSYEVFKGTGAYIQTLESTIIPVGVTLKYREKFGKDQDNLKIADVFDPFSPTFTYADFSATEISLGPVNNKYYGLVGYDNYIPDGYKYIDLKNQANQIKFQTINPHSIDNSLLIPPLGASTTYGIATPIDIYNSSYGSNVKHWTFRPGPKRVPIIDINGLQLLGVSSKYFTPLTPQQNGFTLSGSVDGNYRSVGQLNIPDKTLSTNNPNNLAGANNTFTYTQDNLTNIPVSPTNDGTSFLIGAPSAVGFGSTSNRGGLTTPGDFRKKLRQQNPATYGTIPKAPDYTKANIEQRLKMGNPGYLPFKNLESYKDGTNGLGNASNSSYDEINAAKIYSNAVTDNPDLVLFKIGIIDNDTPANTTYIQFRAFLDQISDNYTSNWDSVKYIGRGENFYTYSGFERKVSLSWTVAAQSKIELIPMYKKLNYLASICAPDYSGAGFMRGNIVTLTIGGYFYEQPGIITGFNYEMNNDNATWEIGIGDDDEASDDESVRQLPHLIKVSSFNFTPIHTFVPRKQQLNLGKDGYVTDEGYGPERYIALKDKTGDKETYGTVYTNPNTATSNAAQSTVSQPKDSNPQPSPQTGGYTTTTTNTFSARP